MIKVNFNAFSTIINNYKLEGIPDTANLFISELGFYFEGNTEEETNELNSKWRWYLNLLNNLAGYEEYLTVEQIAQHLKVSTNTVYSILYEEELPYLKVKETRGIRIKLEDYLRFLQEIYISEE